MVSNISPQSEVTAFYIVGVSFEMELTRTRCGVTERIDYFTTIKDLSRNV